MLWDEWASVLELSCMWQMSKVREMAVQEILRLHKQAGTECQKVLLKLSNRLGIRDIRDAVIRALSRALGPVEQIQLGTEYQVDSWLLEGYKQLVLMKDGISAEDEEHLGWKTTSKLFRVRDAYLLQTQFFCGYYGFSLFNYIFTPLVQEMFAEELESARWGGEQSFAISVLKVHQSPSVSVISLVHTSLPFTTCSVVLYI